MEAKVRWDGPNDFYQRIVEKSSFPEVAQYGFGILPDGHVRVELRTSSATASVNVDSIAIVATGVETHLVAIYDGAVIRIYVNGVLDSETRAPGSISPKPPTPANLIESGVGQSLHGRRAGVLDRQRLCDGVTALLAAHGRREGHGRYDRMFFARVSKDALRWTRSA